MKDKLKRAAIAKRRDLKYWFDMAKDPNTNTTYEDMFYAVLTAGQLLMLEQILIKDFDEYPADTYDYIKEIRKFWEGLEQ